MSRYTQYFGNNNVKATLSAGISSTATSIQVNEGQGNLFGTNFPILATLEHFNTDGSVGKREIVKITAKTDDTFTVVRKFGVCPPSDDSNTQGQTNQSFDAGDSFSIYIPYEILNAVSQSIIDLYNNGNDRLFVKPIGGLNIEVSGGNVRFNNGDFVYEGGTATVNDNTINYVMLNEEGQIVVEQDQFDINMISLAEITAVNGEITQIKMRKLDSRAGELGGGGADPIYGDGSDGELTITEDTILTAGYEYNFTNLYICPGVHVSFSGGGGAKIHVNGLFCNEGIIDATDLDVEAHQYTDKTTFCCMKNIAFESLKLGCGGCGGEGTNICECYSYSGTKTIGQKGCPGGNAVAHPTCCCVGAGGNRGGAKRYTYSGCVCACCQTSGKDGYNRGGGGGGGGYDNQEYNCCSYVGCFCGKPGNGLNGGNGGMTGGYSCSSLGHMTNYSSYSGGGGGGGGFYTGNGGNGGCNYQNGQYFCSRDSACCPAIEDIIKVGGGNGGNGGILGNGGNGGGAYSVWNGGDGGDGGCCGGDGGCGGIICNLYCLSQAGDIRYCCNFKGVFGNGGNGGAGYYGGKGGNGGNVSFGRWTDSTNCYLDGGNGGNGGAGVVPGQGGNGGNILCTNNTSCCGGKGGNGGNGCSTLHSLNIKAKCFCNTGCILSVGSVGGRGGNGGCGCCGIGGNGGNGGQGGSGGTIQIITECELNRGCINVAGGVGGPGGSAGTGGAGNGTAGSQGASGDNGTLHFFILEG